MLVSTKLQKRQSEVRQQLAVLAGKENPDETELREMAELDKEYGTLEQRFRAALIAEDEERREAGADLETRSDREYADLIGKFEMHQIVRALDEGRALEGETAEVVQEMRSQGGYQGFPVPLEALELRTGETVASGVFDPKTTRPVIDRIFPQSAMAKMGGQLVNIPMGIIEWPVATSSITAGWSSSETGNTAGPTVFATTDRAMAPNQNLGIQAKITRRSMKQSGEALEAAVRRDLNGAISQELDNAAFLGSGSSGEPDGVVAKANATYSITETDISAGPTWAKFRAGVQRMMSNNAVGGPDGVRIMIRPEVWDDLDGTIFDSGSGLTELDRMMKHVASNRLCVTANGLDAPSGSPTVSKALLTCSPGGVAPFFVGIWGGVDIIRDVVSDAQSGGLRITAILTADTTVARPAQLEVLTNIQAA